MRLKANIFSLHFMRVVTRSKLYLSSMLILKYSKKNIVTYVTSKTSPNGPLPIERLFCTLIFSKGILNVYKYC